MPDYDEWYQHFKDLRDGYVQPDQMDVTGIVGSGKRNRMLKEMIACEKEMEAHEKQIEACEKQIALHEQQSPTKKQVTPVAQALEIAKWEMEREQKENQGSKGGQKTHKKFKTPMNWNSFRYQKMNSTQLHDVLLGYSVTICTADQLKIERGMFVISNTDTRQGPRNTG